MEANHPATIPLPIRDERYYFDDGAVIFSVRHSHSLGLNITIFTTFQCDGILYKLHKSRLTMKSEFFKNMFELPQRDEEEGQDDEHPIHLSDDNIDFRHLLVFLYDQYVFCRGLYHTHKIYLPEMKSITPLCDTTFRFSTCRRSTTFLRRGNTRS